MNKTMQTLKDRFWIEFVDDERRFGNGIIITLKEPFTFFLDPDSGVMGFDTLTEAEKETRWKWITTRGNYNK